MARETSIEAYRYLVENGALAEMNKLVYHHLWLNGPTTQKKTERFYNDRTYTLRPRFAQLEKMGLIKPIGTEKCAETGRSNILWDVTERVYPLPLFEKSNKKEALIQRVSRFYDKVDVFYKAEVQEIFNMINAL